VGRSLSSPLAVSGEKGLFWQSRTSLDVEPEKSVEAESPEGCAFHPSKDD